MSEHETPENEEQTPPPVQDEALDDVVPADEPVDGEVAADVEEEDEITLLTRERDDYKDRWMRSVAEQENLRRRTRRDVDEARVYATSEMVRPLLEVLDDFERAEASLDADPEEAQDGDSALESYRNGVRLVHDRLRELLNRKGVTRLEVTPGHEFDPELHEAVAQLPSEEIESGAIIDVVQAGYRYKDRTLRAARVVVAQ